MTLVCDVMVSVVNSSEYFSEADFRKEQIGLETGEPEGGGAGGMLPN